MAKGPERLFTDKLVAALRLLPDSEWVKIAAGPWQTSGLPDLLGCYRGRFMAVEVKEATRRTAKDGGLTEKQADWLQRYAAVGARCFVVYTSASVADAVAMIALGVRHDPVR
jgi:penicillin-binding protein-related factor A (putative recombinase)